jgi:hypothetical protein
MSQYGYVFCLASRENPTLVRIDWMPRTSTRSLNLEHLTGFINVRESSRGNAGWKVLIAKYDVPKPEKAFREIQEFMRHVHIQPDVDLYFATEVVLRRYFTRIEGHFYTDI